MATGDLTTLADVKAWLGLTGKPITAITRANPGVVTCPNHQLVTNQLVGFSGIVGMVQLNGLTPVVTVLTTDTFSINVDTSAFTAWVQSGFVQPDDPMLTALVSRVSAAIQQRINRTIALTSFTEKRNGNGRAALPLINYPIATVTSVLVDGTAIAARTTPTGSGWSNDDDTVYLGGSSFTKGKQNVEIVYSAGYAAVPADLAQCAIEVCAFKYRNRSRIGVSTETLAGQMVSYLRDLPNDLLEAIDQYKRVYQPA